MEDEMAARQEAMMVTLEGERARADSLAAATVVFKEVMEASLMSAMEDKEALACEGSAARVRAAEAEQRVVVMQVGYITHTHTERERERERERC